VKEREEEARSKGKEDEEEEEEDVQILDCYDVHCPSSSVPLFFFSLTW